MTPHLRTAHGGTLVLGGGFAGAYVARGLGRQGATIVNPANFMLYTPLLPEAAAGSIEPRHVTVPLRTMCPHAELLLGRAVSLDPERKVVHVTSEAGEFAVGYERLVVALGSVTSMPHVPGLREHALGLKDIGDAIRLRNHVLRQLELADADPASAERRLTFVFAGAGFAGVEAVAELQELAEGALRRHPRLAGVRPRWVLVDSGPRILGQVPESLARFAARTLPGAAWRSSPRPRSPRSTGAAPCCPTAAGSRPRPSSGRPASPPTPSPRSSGCRSTRAAACRWTSSCACGGGRRARARRRRRRAQRGDRRARPADLPARAAPGPPARRATCAGARSRTRYKTLGSMATLGRRHGIATSPACACAGILGWTVARGYHLMALPFAARRPRARRLDRRRLLPPRRRGADGMRWRRELLLFGAAYLLYNAGRGFTNGDMNLAIANANWVLDVQGGVGVERSVQDAFGGVWMFLLSHIYLAAQIVVLPGALVAMYRWAPRIYPRLRDTVIVDLDAVAAGLRAVPRRAAAARRARHDRRGERAVGGRPGRPLDLVLQPDRGRAEPALRVRDGARRRGGRGGQAALAEGAGAELGPDRRALDGRDRQPLRVRRRRRPGDHRRRLRHRRASAHVPGGGVRMIRVVVLDHHPATCAGVNAILRSTRRRAGRCRRRSARAVAAATGAHPHAAAHDLRLCLAVPRHRGPGSSPTPLKLASRWVVPAAFGAPTRSSTSAAARRARGRTAATTRSRHHPAAARHAARARRTDRAILAMRLAGTPDRDIAATVG